MENIFDNEHTERFKKAYTQNRPISEILPLTFKGEEITSIRCTCPECGNQLPEKLIMGTVRIYADYMILRGCGVCVTCVKPIEIIHEYGGSSGGSFH